MSFAEIRRGFVDRTARKPSGKVGVKMYKDPKGHYRSFKAVLEKLQLTPEDVYMEIGSGGGSLLAIALKTVKSAAAIDHSPDMVELARQKNLADVDAGKLEILAGNAEKLPWPDNTFTAGASANMFFFVEHPEVVLREMYRVLKPGGRFVLVTTGRGLLGRMTFGWLYSLRTYTDDAMRSMFEKAGFTNVDIKTDFTCMQLCSGAKCPSNGSDATC